MTKPVILTGLRANNDLTLGNYFGGMLPIIDMAKTRSDEYQVNMFIPDLHSFTTPIDHSKLHEQIMQTAKLFVAAGLPLNHSNIYLYRQSYISAHSELTWILDCFTGFGQMNRMTQFKDKMSLSKEKELELRKELTRDIDSCVDAILKTKPSFENRESIHESLRGLFAEVIDYRIRMNSNSSVGIFNYPVLMAADILLYGARYVPVGDDQTQHLEYTRDIAERMNARFGELFIVPEPVKKQHEFFGKDQGLRVMDLADPTKKMSKSDDSGKGVIFLSDAPEAAAKKVMSATTDSVGAVHYDPSNQPGISNLLEIHALLSGESLKKVIEHHQGETNYGALKKEIAEQVRDFLTDFQDGLARVDDAAVLAKLEQSEAAMNAQANATLLGVQKGVGLRV